MIEKILISFLGFIAGYVFAIVWVKNTKQLGSFLTDKTGYHLHHTLFIIPAILLAVLFSNSWSIFFLSAGIGALFHDIVQHKGKLKFITKD